MAKTRKKVPTTARAKSKIKKVMKEFKGGKLHSTNKKGPKVRSRKQAVAIALSEASNYAKATSDRRSAGKKKSARKSTARKTTARKKK